MGLPCAEQNAGNPQTWTVGNSGTPVRSTKRQKSKQNGVSGILGLLCAEQDVGNLKQCTFSISGTPVRRRKRRKSPKSSFQQLWDSRAQNKTSEISKNARSEIGGPLCAEQHVGNIKRKMHVHVLLDSGSQNKTSEISKMSTLYWLWTKHVS